MPTNENVKRVVSAGGRRMEAVEGVREVRDNIAHAIDKSLKTRPYTTLALAVAVGFLLGAIWTR